MKYLDIEEDELLRLGGLQTAKEISQQPAIWLGTAGLVLEEIAALKKFFATAHGFRKILITGAGTSSYIGLSLRGLFQRKFKVPVEAIATTDLITHPEDYFLMSVPILLISFARSGNSPESVAVLELADEFNSVCHHLIITCNAEGELANHNVKGLKYVFTLPQAANDAGLAMTSSYTGMLLAGKLIAHLETPDKVFNNISRISQYAEKAINYYASEVRHIAALDFKRAVFLGSGPGFGVATEGQLKLQELTDGKIICKNDSFLGFRHGPKAVIDNTTLVVYLFSNNHHSLQYEKDLVHAMEKGKKPLLEISISERQVEEFNFPYMFTFSEDGSTVDEEFMTICSAVLLQLLAFYKSLHLGLKPDTPSESGAISRVVEGVHIYSLK